MTAGRNEAEPYHALRGVIRGVRRRWRLKVALRGAAIVFVTGLIAFAASAYAMDHFRYEPWAVSSFRLFAYLALLALAVRFLVLPLWGRVSDERVALYLEEHEPSLQASVLSAVEVGRTAAAEGRADRSPALIRRLVETAIEKCQTIEYGRPVERTGLRRASALLAAAAATGMLVAILSPAFLRHAAPFLLAPWSVRAASPYAIAVEPGHATIPRGGSQAVTARLQGFDAEAVELAVRTGASADWKRWPMTADEGAQGFRFVLFGLDAASDYFVEAGGVRSPQFRIDVSDLPYVKKIDLEYHFPAYTGLSPQAQEDSGDVVVLRGAEVRVRVMPTIPVASGRLRVDGAEPQAMTVGADGALSASFKATAEGFYRIELPRRDGTLQAASPEYTIDVLADQPPSITLVKPGRDAKVTSIEEVFTEWTAEDDYGVGRAELVYSVNGAPNQTVSLHQGRARKALTAGHTFFLEELGLEPGDFISYFARATDQGAPAQTATTDIYFMEVRPFDREYRQADQRGGQAGGGEGSDGALSFQQRQIIAATFKLVRDRAKATEKQHAEDTAVLAQVQGRLHQQVQSLVQRMGNRGVLEPGSDFDKTAQSLRSAAEEMASARAKLDGRQAKEALAPEQAALKHLQRAEAAFREVQVSFEQGGQGGGAMNAEDLADLFELELDKLKNQYETVQRGAERQADNQVDEALERLRELARRQEQEIERQRQLAGRAPNQGGGGGRGSQQDLARQTEELARQLERLAREQSSPAMQETARRLQDAANAMKRSSRASGEGGMGDSAAALERLRDARRRLENTQAGRTERDIREAQRAAQELARNQEKIAAEAAEQLARPGGSRGAQGTPGTAGGRASRLMERKDEMAREVSDLEAQLDKMAQDARAGKKDAARRLQEAADGIRDRKLRDKIRYSKGVLSAGAAERSQQLEAEIASDLEALGRKLDQAASAAGPSDKDKREASLERMRDLARNLESLQERLRERSPLAAGREREAQGQAEEGRRGQEGQEGQGGQRSGQRAEGSEGQPGGEGREPGEGGTQAGGGPGREARGEARGREAAGGAADGGPGGGSPQGDLAAGGRPRFTPGDSRQLRRELRERLREAEALGREMGGAGGPYDLSDVVRGLRRGDSEQAFQEPRGLERLVAAAVEDLKAAEFALRREVEGPDREKLFLSGSQDVPAGWQRLVEEYYRSLARPGESER
jgi:hypothetical protein